MKKSLFAIALALISINVFSLNPSRTYSAKPSDYGLKYEEVKIVTEDNVYLKGWLYKPEKISYNMIVLSDDGDGNMADLIEIASNFVTLGFNVLTYDYRGYGESDDFEINKNFFIYAQFEKDLDAAVTYVRKYHSKTKVLDLYGIGIGAGLSITIGANRNEVLQVIADSPYSKLEDMKKRIKEKRNQDVLLPLGYNKYLLEPYYALETKGSNLYGVMFIVGDKDDLVTPGDLKELAKVVKNRTSFFVVKGVTSKETFTTDKNKYFEEIRTFIKFPN